MGPGNGSALIEISHSWLTRKSSTSIQECWLSCKSTTTEEVCNTLISQRWNDGDSHWASFEFGCQAPDEHHSGSQHANPRGINEFSPHPTSFNSKRANQNLSLRWRFSLQSCTVLSSTKMICNIPQFTTGQQLDAKNHTADYFIGFVFDGYDEYLMLDEDKHNISAAMTLLLLPPVEQQHWPVYNSSTNESLALEVKPYNFPILCVWPLHIDAFNRSNGAHFNMRSVSWLMVSIAALSASTTASSVYSSSIRTSSWQSSLRGKWL